MNDIFNDLAGIKQKLQSCELCPRNCRVNRLEGEIGYCGESSDIYVARAALHHWEEPCISGDRGSGTVFFTGCNMRCVFCQNYKISSNRDGVHQGQKVSIEQLSEIFLKLEKQGAHNINLVTPTHYAVQVKEAIMLAKEKGIRIPFVYNSSGYEKVETLQTLDGLIDIYLPDFKYMDEERAKKYSGAPDYPLRAKAAIAEMVRQVGEPVFQDGIMIKGVIARHLVMPDANKDAKQIIRYLSETYGETIFISILNQYTPISEQLKHYPEINQRVSMAQYERCVDFAERLGVANAYVQENSAVGEEFIPSFQGEGVNED